MNTLRCILAVLLLCGSSATLPASAEDNDPLFVNLTTDEAFRTMMAMRPLRTSSQDVLLAPREIRSWRRPAAR
jgi:hypothetical protein